MGFESVSQSPAEIKAAQAAADCRNELDTPGEHATPACDALGAAGRTAIERQLRGRHDEDRRESERRQRNLEKSKVLEAERDLMEQKRHELYTNYDLRSTTGRDARRGTLHRDTAELAIALGSLIDAMRSGSREEDLLRYAAKVDALRDAVGLATKELAVSEHDLGLALVAERDQVRHELGDKGHPHSLGQTGALVATLKYTEHEAALYTTGNGVYGATYTDPENRRYAQRASAGKKSTDCMSFVMEVLGDTFAQAGQAAVWKQVVGRASGLSHARGTGLTGIDIISALQEIGWQNVFLIADTNPKTSENRSFPRHLADLQTVERHQPMFAKPESHVPGATISQVAKDYAPHNGSSTHANAEAMAKLRQIPFGMLVLRGGGAVDGQVEAGAKVTGHTAIWANGKIIELHVGLSENNPNLLQRSDIGDWEYKSAILTAPGDDIKRAWGERPRNA